MPEGNEVHRFAERQQRTFGGKKLHVDSPNGRFSDAAAIKGRRLKRIDAFGKHLLYRFGRDTTLHVHLGRFGDFTEGKMPLPEPRGALRLRIWTAKDWLELRGATDISLYTDEKVEALLARLGPDPLRADADPASALDTIAQAKTPVAALLMDQSVIAGIGNIYRAELLYRARLDPYTPGKDVPRKTTAAIWRDAVKLMPDGMVDRRIVTTRPKDRLHPRGKPLRDEVHYVYRRHGKPCLVCGTTVKRADMAGRTLYWCPECQQAM